MVHQVQFIELSTNMSPHKGKNLPNGQKLELSATLSNPHLHLHPPHLSLSSSAVTNELAGQGGGGKKRPLSTSSAYAGGCSSSKQAANDPEQFFFSFQFPNLVCDSAMA
ncbi:hypothetical protein CEXT_633971 [Caerostris extrusa]|uniref:Uncharacterized protein n=1 Tax=Caerostris extrusa TaxID=172846 RepID=A0AAV4XWI9_CAEEX|nr:hypothetical protein CEXT_633971 [Caerostris extrusa]